MNTPKLPPLPDTLDKAIHEFARAALYYEREGRIAAMNQLKKAIETYAIAAITAQGVPDAMLSALQRIADWKSHDLELAADRGSNGVRDFYRQIAIDALASAPPAPQAAVVQQGPVAYLDIGAVGYIDLGTDLSTEQLQALPAGRHMLGIIGTFGADGYVPAKQAKPQPLSDEQIEKGRKATFSTDNPFCPCDSKTMRKAVRWAEAAHGIKE